MAKTGETGVIETVAKMGGNHCGKNGWRSPWQKRVKLVLEKPWQKWVELAVAKMGENHCGKNGYRSSWQKWVKPSHRMDDITLSLILMRTIVFGSAIKFQRTKLTLF